MIRTAVRFLAATILALALAIIASIQWTGTALWLTLLAVAACAALATRWNVVWAAKRRELDAGIAHVHVVNDCDRGGHAYRKQPTPTVWRCALCGDVRESSSGYAS